MLGEYIGPGQSKYTDYDAAVTQRTGNWFAERAAPNEGRPRCLYVGLAAPHFPLVVPQDFYDLYPLDRLPPVKLHPGDGYRRHPWVEKQNAMMDSEARFADNEELLKAMVSYYGLCSWLDYNVGQILTSLDAAGFGDNTTVIYTSDHGDNVGARGLWGKSTLYQESVAVPMIMAGPNLAPGTCDTPVSLLDISATVPDHFGLSFEGDGASLHKIAADADDLNRPILSEYHAAGAVSGGFMLRTGRTPSDITHLFFTHYHSDHMMDDARLVHAAWDDGAAPLKVFGPAPLSDITDGYFVPHGVLSNDLRARTELPQSQQVWVARGGTLPRRWPAAEVTEIGAGFACQGNGWRLASARANHAQPVLDCLGFAVEAEGKKFVYSGDTGINPDMTALCQDADLLLHWCYRGSGELLHPALMPFSPDPREVAEMAKGAGVTRLLLSHFRIHMDAEQGHAKARADLADTFTGDAGIAEDLQTYDI